MPEDSRPPVIGIKQQPINGQSSGLDVPKSRFNRTFFWISTSAIALILTSIIAAAIWYNFQLSPRGGANDAAISVKIESGMTPGSIGKLLEDRQIIRSGFVFEIYARLRGLQDSLQVGSYSLSPSSSTAEIVEALTKGSVDTIDVTFYPGATLKQNRQVLIDAGYSSKEVDAALNKTYTSPLFDTRPAGKDLEGYIYGETYRFNSGASVEMILERTFDHYYDVLSENNLIQAFREKDLTLYEAITLASIIQREVSGSADQKIVAQVFFSRLNAGIQLGSDVTYQYIADKLGLARDPNLSNPYNTRKYIGLPPGPIASPGLTALIAVASPANTSYLYFLSGDDGITYFAKTEAEHNANIRNHCQKKCSVL